MNWPKRFHKTPCKICGKLISNCGFAYTNHDKMHKREEAKRKQELIKQCEDMK